VYALRVLKSSRIDLELFNEGDHSMSEVEHHILPQFSLALTASGTTTLPEEKRRYDDA
jgi:hypothetical protein